MKLDSTSHVPKLELVCTVLRVFKEAPTRARSSIQSQTWDWPECIDMLAFEGVATRLIVVSIAKVVEDG